MDGVAEVIPTLLRGLRDLTWAMMGLIAGREPEWWWMAIMVGVPIIAVLGSVRDRMLVEEAQAREREWWQRAKR